MSTPAPAPQPIGFDARPLTDPVDKAEVKAWRQQHGKGGSSGCGTVFIIAFLAVFLLVGLGMGRMAISTLASGSGFEFAMLPLIIVPIMFIGIPVFVIVGMIRGGGRAMDYRLHRFAQANGMSYVPESSDPKLPGMIFGRGNSRRASYRVRGTRPRFVEFGNYSYTTGSGKNKTTHRWGYVAIHLDTPLPHIVLDAVGNNSVFGSNLPTAFDRDQRLSLEGDFDEHFALYCPQGYERDALYLFTPDIMARFMDNAAQLDVEIVDDWLFLYTRRRVSTLDPANWAWLFSVVSALMDKLSQWGRWRDERLAQEQAAHAAWLARQGHVPDGATANAGTPGADATPDGGAAEGSTSAPLGAGAAPAPTDPAGQLPFHAHAMLTPPRGVAEPGRRLKKGWSWTAVAGGIALFIWFALNVFASLGD